MVYNISLIGLQHYLLFPKCFQKAYNVMYVLQRVQRTGWVLRRVSNPESVADHMYRMSVLSFLVDPASGLNKEK